MIENVCNSCFEVSNIMPCVHCGYNGEIPEKGEILSPGTILNGKYMLGKVLGHGGFGITYLAYDLNFDFKIAVKEYYPYGLCTRTRESKNIYTYSGEASASYKYGLNKFVDEGKTMAKFRNLESIVDVRDYFMENNSAYLVMEHLDGVDLNQYLKRQPDNKLSLEAALSIIRPILDTLKTVHAQGIIHRDISPDNIFITVDNKIKLLDFGAARYAISEKSKSLSVILKQGYAPPEQYSSRGKQGPWTDIYAVGATMFKMLTAKTPIEAAERQMGDEEFEEELELLPSRIKGTIANAMSFKPTERTQSVDELLRTFTVAYNNIYDIDTQGLINNNANHEYEKNIEKNEYCLINEKDMEYTPNEKIISVKKQSKVLTIFLLAYVCGIIIPWGFFIFDGGAPLIFRIVLFCAGISSCDILVRTNAKKRNSPKILKKMSTIQIFFGTIYYMIMGALCTAVFLAVLGYIWYVVS